MAKLWEKDSGAELNTAVNRYIINKDLEADNALIPFDVQASIAHARMLAQVGLLDKSGAQKLIDTLSRISDLHAKGDFVLRQENEDVHTEIENFLVKELGELGKRIHVGRSRNDQVLVAMRLYAKHELSETMSLLIATALTILDFASKYEFVPMAGFTHMQHAMPSSVGQWASSFVESLLNDLEILESAEHILDQNPLGSAAGFGTSLAIDREQTTALLGFKKTQVNPIYCQNSRAKLDSYTIGCLFQTMLTLGKIANDLVIFTSQEFSFFNVDSALTTGSSIMPQKRNLDVMEVLRANVSVVQSLQLQVQSASLNLISGYNKDLKFGKKAVMDAFNIAQESLAIVDLLFRNLQPNHDGLSRAFKDSEIFATDLVNDLVMKGAAFRDAYKQVGQNLSQVAAMDPVQNITAKKHLGATGNLGLDGYRHQLEAGARARGTNKA